ncbi:EamA family transporter [Brucella intermedia]|uniref:EamA family transporter n=2 Tax=Brucella intermedia TaxID=94625 RepID=UPI002B05F189|nr:EamA family transporter [Brucella intermedia]
MATTVIPTAISIMFQRYVPPVTTAFLYTLEPIWSAVFAAGILGEHLSARSYLGGLAILLGAALHGLPLSCFPFVPGRKDRQ